MPFCRVSSMPAARMAGFQTCALKDGRLIGASLAVVRYNLTIGGAPRQGDRRRVDLLGALAQSGRNDTGGYRE